MYLMDITVSNSLNVDFKVKFSKAEFSSFMSQSTEVGIFLGASSLFFSSLMTLYKCLNPINEYARSLGTMRKLMSLIMSIFYISIAILMFLLTLPVSTHILPIFAFEHNLNLLNSFAGFYQWSRTASPWNSEESSKQFSKRIFAPISQPSYRRVLRSF